MNEGKSVVSSYIMPAGVISKISCTCSLLNSKLRRSYTSNNDAATSSKNNNKTIENKKINRRKVNLHVERNVFRDTGRFCSHFQYRFRGLESYWNHSSNSRDPPQKGARCGAIDRLTRLFVENHLNSTLTSNCLYKIAGNLLLTTFFVVFYENFYGSAWTTHAI